MGKQRTFLPYAVLGLGTLGAVFRAWFLLSRDARGLPLPNHPGDILTWAAAVVCLAVILLGLRGMQDERQHHVLFPPALLPGIATFSAAVGLAVTEIPLLLSGGDAFSWISGFLGMLAAVAMIPLGVCRIQGKRPAFLPLLLVNVYFLFQPVWQYRQWMWSSQLQVYAIPLIASVLLMLAAYHRCALFAGVGSRRSYVFFSLAAGLFCLLAIPGQRLAFYLTMALWMLTGTGSLALEPEQGDAP